MKLDVYYDSETDTLSLWNGQPASEGADVAENLTVDLDAEGEAVGFTLEHASEILKEIGAVPFLAWNPKGRTPEGSLRWALPFHMENSEGMTLENNEWSSEILKAIGVRPVRVENPQVLTPEYNQLKTEMLKAVGTHPFLIWNPQDLTPKDIEGNPQGLTPEDNQLKTEMLKAVGGHQVIVLEPEGLTPEDMEKLAIRPTVWVGHLGHFVDSGKK